MRAFPNPLPDTFKPRSRDAWNEVRYQLCERDGWKCEYCACPITFSGCHIEHMIPRARGGTDHFVNLTVSCPTCNLRKGVKTFCEFTDPEWREPAA